ncbi:MAG: TadE/TadG family type IV pilus assembly protein [Pseudomonadota bacterium]
MAQLGRCAQRLLKDRSGVVALEFALVLPMLVTMLLGAAEFGRAILLSQKLQNGAFILADLVGRDADLDTCTLTDVFSALEIFMEPFDFAGSGTAVVTAVKGTAFTGPIVAWQETGDGSPVAVSKVGAVLEEASIPDVITLDTDETLIVTEVLFDFEPLFGLLMDPYRIHKVAYHKPRLGTLDTLSVCPSS